MRGRGSEGGRGVAYKNGNDFGNVDAAADCSQVSIVFGNCKERPGGGAAWNFVAVVVARRLLNENNAAYIIYMYTKARLRQTHTHEQTRTNTHKHVRDTVGETSQLGIKSSSSFSLSENK